MENISFNTLHSGSSIIIAIIGLYFIVKTWIIWQYIDIDVLKARVFLNKKFLKRNWRYIFLSGASQAIHQFVELLLSLNYLAKTPLVEQISGILEIMALVFLVLLTYEWYIVLKPKTKTPNAL